MATVDGVTPVLHLSIRVHDLRAARAFYVDTLGCRPGRAREDWIDLWFFGMQLTLQLRPHEVRAADDQGVRPFGVALSDAVEYRAVLDRLASVDVVWLSPPQPHDDGLLSGKAAAKVADPSGNVIELKFYADPSDYLHDTGGA